MEPAGTIILLTGAGGVLKQLLIDSNWDWIWPNNSPALCIDLVAFGISVIRVLRIFNCCDHCSSDHRTFQWQAVNLPFFSTITIAIASGASIFSHVNDSGFWLVSQYLGMDETKTFKSWSIMTTILGVTGFLMVMLLSLWV